MKTKLQQLPFTDHTADKSALGLTLVLVDILKYFFGDRDHQLCMNVPCKYALFSARGPYIQLHSGLLYVTQLYYHAFCNSKSVCLCTRYSLLARVLGRNLPNRVSGMSFLYPISICFATLLNDSE